MCDIETVEAAVEVCLKMLVFQEADRVSLSLTMCSFSGAAAFLLLLLLLHFTGLLVHQTAVVSFHETLALLFFFSFTFLLLSIDCWVALI